MQSQRSASFSAMWRKSAGEEKGGLVKIGKWREKERPNIPICVWIQSYFRQLQPAELPRHESPKYSSFLADLGFYQLLWRVP